MEVLDDMVGVFMDFGEINEFLIELIIEVDEVVMECYFEGIFFMEEEFG